MTRQRFVYIWQYTVDPELRSEFLEAYRAGGAWTALFSRDSSYIETLLLQDDNDENIYVTIDYWKSRADRDAFRERYATEFSRLDSRCEAYTLEEQFLGDFNEVQESSG